MVDHVSLAQPWNRLLATPMIASLNFRVILEQTTPRQPRQPHWPGRTLTGLKHRGVHLGAHWIPSRRTFSRIFRERRGRWHGQKNKPLAPTHPGGKCLEAPTQHH